MALSIYSATGPIGASAVTKSLPKVVFNKVSSGFCPLLNENNLLDRYVNLRKFSMTVQVQGVPSSGHKVTFMDKQGRIIDVRESNVSGVATGVFAGVGEVTAVIEDKAGGDIYNSMIRTGLVTVPFDVR